MFYLPSIEKTQIIGLLIKLRYFNYHFAVVNVVGIKKNWSPILWQLNPVLVALHNGATRM
jgi:hypothetical protein